MSHVSAGAVMTLVVPLSLLMVVLLIWGFGQRRLLRRKRASRAEAPDA